LCSPLAITLFNEFEEAILAEQPCSLGPPSNITQSAYYPDCSEISQEEIDEISTVMHSHSIGPENTRIQKTIMGHSLTYTILQASVEISTKRLTDLPLHRPVYIDRGDYSPHLKYVCQFLEMARLHSANPLQSEISSFHQRSFISGDLEMYKEGQRLWVKDKSPSIETNFGFVEPYRDPFGTRAEFEGIVGLVNKDETKTLTNLVQQADKFVRRLPWVKNTGNGYGAFEKESFGSPDFTSVHSKCLYSAKYCQTDQVRSCVLLEHNISWC
jgi:dipeptidyl-peptidase-3